MPDDARKERVAFLGLGIMGSRMAANIARAGFPLTVWTHTPGKAEAWAREHNAQVAATPGQAAGAGDIIISMVVDGPQVEAVMLGEDGVAGAAHPGLLVLDMSTIGPAAARSIGAALGQHGVAMLDAPVTGSSPRAEDGTLTIMVGGAKEAYERARPLLETMGSLIVRVGELGQGQMLKLLNNAVGAANAAALAEALLLAEATGIELGSFEQVLAAGSGGSVQLQLKAQAMHDRDFHALFKTEHMLKDVRLCLEEAQGAGLAFGAAAHAQELLAAAVERGRGSDDYASIIESAG